MVLRSYFVAWRLIAEPHAAYGARHLRVPGPVAPSHGIQTPGRRRRTTPPLLAGGVDGDRIAQLLAIVRSIPLLGRPCRIAAVRRPNSPLLAGGVIGARTVAGSVLQVRFTRPGSAHLRVSQAKRSRGPAVPAAQLRSCNSTDGTTAGKEIQCHGLCRACTRSPRRHRRSVSDPSCNAARHRRTKP